MSAVIRSRRPGSPDPAVTHSMAQSPSASVGARLGWDEPVQVCGETGSDEQTARRRPVPVRDPSGEGFRGARSGQQALLGQPVLHDRGRVELLAGGVLVECAQFVGRERSLDRVDRLDGLRIEAVRHQRDDVLRQDEVLGLPEDDQAVFADGGAGGVDVGDVDILLVRVSTVSGVAGVLHRGDLGVVPVDPLEALGPVGAGGELGVRGH